jgi:hypothetical protein
VVDPERLLAFDRGVVVGDGVEQPPAAHLLGGAVAVDRDGNIVLAQQKAEVQAGDAGPDNADSFH